METPFLEYARLGRMDRAGATLLFRIAGNVAASGLPPMDGDRWDQETTQGLATDFVAREKFAGDVNGIFLRSDDDDSFARQLHGAMRRFHITRLRRTEAGRLFRRVDRLLADHPDLELVETAAGQALRRTGDSSSEPWAGPDEDLYAAARNIDVERTRWRPSSRRQDPGVTDLSLVSVIDSVVTAAGRPVLHTTLHRTLKAVFGLYDPSSVTLPDEPAPPGPDDIAIADVTARAVWEQLSKDERLLLANPGSYREIAAHLGIGKSTAERRVKRLAAILERMIGLDEDAQSVVTRLHQIAESVYGRDEP